MDNPLPEDPEDRRREVERLVAEGLIAPDTAAFLLAPTSVQRAWVEEKKR